MPPVVRCCLLEAARVRFALSLSLLLIFPVRTDLPINPSTIPPQPNLSSWNPKGLPHGRRDATRQYGASAAHYTGEGRIYYRCEFNIRWPFFQSVDKHHSILKKFNFVEKKKSAKRKGDNCCCVLSRAVLRGVRYTHSFCECVACSVAHRPAGTPATLATYPRTPRACPGRNSRSSSARCAFRYETSALSSHRCPWLRLRFFEDV